MISGSGTDSDSESEDDEGHLITEQLDTEILATLKAIQSKDPQVYDPQTTFYTEAEEALGPSPHAGRLREKPVYLRDYHRKNLLQGKTSAEVDSVVPATYTAEQRSLRQNLLEQMHTNSHDSDNVDGFAFESDDFLVRKPKEYLKSENRELPLEPDIALADKDPEAFLSNFMASRAWVPGASSKFQPFESDDDEDDDRAEAYEAAYNLRFEDPRKANEKLLSHSREVAANYSVRREEPKGRKRARGDQKSRKDAEKAQRITERARLRNLKIEEAQEKLLMFKEAAGLTGHVLPVEEWFKFLGASWDSDKWDKEMDKQFDENYYACGDDAGTAKVQHGSLGGGTRAKKPKWNDELDIGDIVPAFEEEERGKTVFALSDGEEKDLIGGVALDASDGHSVGKQPHKKRKSKDIRLEQKRDARKERRKLEDVVDRNMITETLPVTSTPNLARPFRYRATSPSAFGLSARDILMADDSQLNQYAGLKKLAPFRDPNKKSKDKKKLGKKARLRRWRKDTFGDERGPGTTFQDFLATQKKNGESTLGIIGTIAGGREDKRAKKTSRKRKDTNGTT